MAERRSGNNRKPQQRRTDGPAKRPRQQGGGQRRSKGGSSGRPGSSKGAAKGRQGGGGGKSGGGRTGGAKSGGSQSRGSQNRGSQNRGTPGRSSDRRERDHAGRHGKGSQPRSGQRRAFSVDGGPSNLPRWLKEEIQRVTPRERQEGTIVLLSEAAADFADEQFGSAHRKLLKAKNMSSRASAIRELLGLTAYRLGNWEEAVRELRAFRRFTGDTTHMPVEMDALRGLGRHRDVEKTWELFMELGGHPATDSEARVVYGSHLLDQDRPKDAWAVTRPKRVTKDGRPHELRRWFVAGRAALALGDTDTASTLLEAVRHGDPDMPGLEELADDIAGAAH